MVRWMLQRPEGEEGEGGNDAAAVDKLRAAEAPLPPAMQLDHMDGTENVGEMIGVDASSGGGGSAAPKTGPLLQEQHRCPDTESLAERLRPCMQEMDEASISSAPGDFLRLFDDEL